MCAKVFKYWYLWLVGMFLVGAAVVFFYFGEESYIAVHDNLDLFVAQFQMLKNTDSFFAHSVSVPFLGGVSRDNLPSEWSLYSVLYMLMPAYAAYVTGYLVKIVMAVVSVWLLAGEWLGRKAGDCQPLIILSGFAYGCLNMFPAFSIPFASIPLVLYLLIRIYRRPSWKLYAALFCFPFLSYFSYFGLFILGYLAVAVIWCSLRDRKFSTRLFLGLVVLSAGFMLFEYRLFGIMLFSDVETIRASIVDADLSAGDIVGQALDVWKNGMFHAESVHTALVLPVCLGGFIWINGRYIVKKNYTAIFHDSYNLLMLVLVFNSLIYGFYFWGDFRRLVETLLPPLKGWQFNRTVFFSPFIWYAAYFMLLERLNSSGIKWCRPLAVVLVLAAAGIVLRTPVKYNDLYTTCKNHVLRIWKDKIPDEMNYREFYSESLFEQVKKDIGYEGEWAAAYGFHPAVLEYNAIATLDGYLGFYPQEYKEDFRKVIAPALERVEASRIYYDEWGARAYLYPGTDLSAVSSSKSAVLTDYDMYIDVRAFKELGGTYIFSRYELSNAGESGLTAVKTYKEEQTPYAVYLYKVE